MTPWLGRTPRGAGTTDLLLYFRQNLHGRLEFAVQVRGEKPGNGAEHACVENSEIDPLRQARTTRAAWWERAFIAPYWVNFHAEHHIFMHLPCWSLPRAHRLLAAKGATQGMEVAPGYGAVLAEASGR